MGSAGADGIKPQGLGVFDKIYLSTVFSYLVDSLVVERPPVVMLLGVFSTLYPVFIHVIDFIYIYMGFSL